MLLYEDNSPTQNPQKWTSKHLLTQPSHPITVPSPAQNQQLLLGSCPSVPSPLPQLSFLSSADIATAKSMAGWGAPVPPPFCCRGAGVSALPLHPPSLISISGQAGPGLPGGGRGTRRFPLIAKINTLKFLQEAEECGTAGKNCFIICNNTKAEGGGVSCERRGKAETKEQLRWWRLLQSGSGIPVTLD